MKILIVDDQPLNRELLAAQLTSAGHIAAEAADGREALRLLECEGADAVISDILMPNMDGYRLCFEIRHHTRWHDLPFIFYTATYTSDADEKLALDLGGDAYLRKPAAAQQIIEILRKVAAKGARPKTKPPAEVSETEVLKEYSERLVSKLEEKNSELHHVAEELARNLAERKRTEDALRLFRTLVDHSNDALEIIDPDTARFLDVNERGCLDLGYAREELLTLTVPDIDPTVDMAEWRSVVKRIRASGSLRVDRRHRRKDGTEFPVEVNITRVSLEREYIVAAVRDITERRRAQHDMAREHARFQFIFGSLPVGIAWMLRDQPASRMVNPAYTRISGVPVEVSVQLELFRQATHPDDRARQDQLHARLLAGKIAHYTIEKRYVHPDGSIIFAELTVRHFRDPATGEVQEISTLVDLTPYQRAEAARHEIEERLRTVTEKAQVGMVIIDAQHCYRYANRPYLEMLRLPEQDLIGRRVADVLASVYEEQIRPRLERAFRGERVNYELRLPSATSGGATRYYAVAYEPGEDASGRIVIVVLTDITAAKESALALEVSTKEHRDLRTALDEHAIVAITDARGKITFVNDKFCAISKYERAELLGQDHRIVNSGYHPKEFFRDLWTTIGHGKVWHGEIKNRAKDGAIYWVATTIVPFLDERGKPRQYVAIRADITKRKLAEESLLESDERFRQIAENINEVFWITDPAKNQMVYISPAYETIWGRTCASLYHFPNNWLEAIHPDDRERVRQAAQTRQAEGKYDETYRILRPDGSVHWIHDKAFPLRDAAGRVYRIVGTAEDVTKEHKLEEQFRQSQKMEAIGTLAGGIAHDFNNILAAMNGYAELARMKLGPGSQVAEYLDHILQAGKRATSLVKQILTFSRRQEQSRTLIQIEDVISESLKLLRAATPTTIEVKISIAANLPTVLADATQIHQVMMNLGTNALHAMRDQRGRLEVTVANFVVDAAFAETHPKLQIGPYVRVSIADTGCGMTKEVLEHLFEPFFTTKGPGEGTGLGLAVVHGIMENHESVITVYSHPGEGTVFHLYFPARGAAPAAGTALSRAIPKGTGQHVLYVDDEAPLAKLGQKTLEHLGYTVESETHVIKALELVRTDPTRFDLVVTDQTMPGMTGIEFAAELQKIRPGLPVILTTGYSATLTAEKIRAAGVRDLLMKPYTVETFGAAMQRALGPK